MRRVVTSISICAALLYVAPATARDHRVPQIPHGDSYGCTSCHVGAAGGGVFTPFGSDTIMALVGDAHVSERDVDWAQLYDRDSDRDGFTNGEELGDPDGQWQLGDRDPIGRHYNPGDPDDHPLATCGDGRVTPPEECDGDNHRELTCTGLGLEDGVLVCEDGCVFDRSGCGDEEPPSTNTNSTPMGSGPADPSPDDESACSVVARSSAPDGDFFWIPLLAALAIFRRRYM